MESESEFLVQTLSSGTQLDTSIFVLLIPLFNGQTSAAAFSENLKFNPQITSHFWHLTSQQQRRSIGVLNLLGSLPPAPERKGAEMAMAERSVRLGEVSHLVMTFLHDEREAFPATRAAFEHEARDALKAIKPGRRGVKTLYEIVDEYLELKREKKEREDRKACFKSSPIHSLPLARALRSVET